MVETVMPARATEVYAVDLKASFQEIRPMAERGKILRGVAAADIRRTRWALGWSREALAHEAGLHRSFIGHVERGETNLSMDNLERLADALKIPASELLVAEAVAPPLPAGS
jgi:ribosome-binding protein aMBF1 (putative translation factor)